MAPDRALYAALLTPQGKYLFDFLLHERGDAILLDGELERLPALVQRLTMYPAARAGGDGKRERQVAMLAVFGADATSWLGLPPEAGAARVEGDVALAVDPRLAELGVRVVLPA